MKVKSESEVSQSCQILPDPVDHSLPGSSIHGILQARVLEWGAIAFSPKNWTQQEISLSLLLCLLIFGCAGSSLLHGLSLVAVNEGYAEVWCAGFSLPWLLLLQSAGSRCSGFSSCGAQASLPHSMWNLPRPRIETLSLALAGRFLTREVLSLLLKCPCL